MAQSISSLDCTFVGKIAAAYDNKMVIFEPPASGGASNWVQTATIKSDSLISVMSFNSEGTRLIAGGQNLQLWVVEGKTNWQCVWRCKTASNITYLKYSPDGTLFCSASKSDRLVKIWYESITNSHTLTPPKYEFSFIYIAHPLPVTGLEWRRTSKYTPRGAMANILITSCKDNIARIWVQTLLPDDGLVNFSQLKGNHSEEDLVNGAPRVQTQRHRQKLLRRLKRMKAFSQFKKRQALALDHSIDELEKVATGTDTPTLRTTTNGNLNQKNEAMLPISNGANQLNGLASNNNNNTPNNNTNTGGNTVLPTSLSAQDFHSYAICSTVVKPGLHFHLAGTIEADYDLGDAARKREPIKLGDLPRADTLDSSSEQLEEEDSKPQFVVHWINNKEIHITRSIELLLHDMLTRILRGNNPASSSTNSPQSAGESCSGSENDTDELDDPNDDTITAESSKKLRHKLCHKMNKQRALAASGRRDPADSDDNSHPPNNSSVNPSLSASNATAPNATSVNASNNGRASPNSLVEEFDKTLESLLKKWQMSADLLFSINKSDGTLTIWQVKYLDGEDTGVFRQVQIDKLSRLRSALPHYYAITMSLNVTAYSPKAYLDVKRAYLAVTSSPCSKSRANSQVGEQQSPPPVEASGALLINTDSINQSTKPSGLGSLCEIKDNISASSAADGESSIFIVTQHLSGILGLWKLNFDPSYLKVQSVDLVTRITGLPIDPLWLRDGVLVAEYLNNEAILIVKWLADESGGGNTLPNNTEIQESPSSSHSKSSTTKIVSAHSEEIKSSLICNLPSVDEESASKPQTTTLNQLSSQEESHIVKDSYRASQMANNIKLLPQYHLKQLIELLAFGKLQRVKAILNHLVNCLIAFESKDDKDTTDTTNPSSWAHRSRTLSIVAQSPPAFQTSFDIDNPSHTIQQHVIEEIELDYIEVTSIKPLPLYLLLKADTEQPHSGDSKSTKHEEFSTSYESIMRARSQVDETLDEILGQSTIDTLNKQKELKKLASDALGKSSLTSFNPKKAKLLTQVLTHTHLPGLSNVDQMHLLAVADAVALFDASPNDLNELHEEEDGMHGGSIGSIISTNIAIDSLDDRGLRFLTAMRQHVYLTRCLPMKQRNELKASGIGNHNLVWAFHSESQDELISLIPCVQRNKPEWSELREFGVGWWLKKLEVLRKLIEKVAQSAYQARQDPLDAALFYLAMKKKTLVCALLRRVNCDKRLLKLFEQDFNDPVNRKKALKNAYALLGLHRFEHAAAFFILAGSIWDAVEVCINNLNDIQLAMILIRLHDNDSNLPNNLRKLLFTEILGSKRPTEVVASSAGQGGGGGMSNSNSINNNSSGSSMRNQVDNRRSSHVGQQYNYDPKRAHEDPFLRSMAFWKLGDYLSAVHTLLESDVGQQRHRPTLAHLTSNQSSISRRNSDSLNTHNNNNSSGQAASNNTTANTATATEPNSAKVCQEIGGRGNVSVSASVFNFYLFLKDQPLVLKHKAQLIEEIEIKKRTSPVEEEQFHCHRARSLSSGELGFDERGLSRTIKQSSTEFEVLNETTRLVDKYSDEAIAEKERVLFFSTAHAYLEAGCPMLALEVLCSEDHLNISQAQRMKFIACLHILMNELNTLAAANSKGGPLPVANQKFRQQFFEWLQESAEAMKKISSYSGTSQAAMDEVQGHLTSQNPIEQPSEPDGGGGRAGFMTEPEGWHRSPSSESGGHQVAAHEPAVALASQGEAHLQETSSLEQAYRWAWVRLHEPILRVMLTYCNLHSATENSLTVVRIELLRLLKLLSANTTTTTGSKNVQSE